MLCDALGRGCVVCVNIKLVCFKVVGHVLENLTLYSRGVPCLLLVLTKMLYGSDMLGVSMFFFLKSWYIGGILGCGCIRWRYIGFMFV